MKLSKKLLYIFLPLVIGGIISLFINSNIDINTLNKPPLVPPSIVFPIVWTILYLLMGISFYLIKKDPVDSDKVNKIYYLQLFLNYIWSIIFFNLKWYIISLIIIILLDIAIFKMIKQFREFNVLSSKLNIPYFIWCLFATYLTIGFTILN